MKQSTVIYTLMGLSCLIIYGLLDPQVFPFPQCPFRSLTGFLCPGCGSQRAIHQLLHGHFLASIHLNALLLPALLYGLIGYMLTWFYPVWWAKARKTWYGTRAAWIAVIIIVVFWIGRNMLQTDPRLL